LTRLIVALFPVLAGIACAVTPEQQLLRKQNQLVQELFDYYEHVQKNQPFKHDDLAVGAAIIAETESGVAMLKAVHQPKRLAKLSGMEFLRELNEELWAVEQITKGHRVFKYKGENLDFTSDKLKAERACASKNQ